MRRPWRWTSGVPGRDVERQVVETVVIDAPHQRAEDLVSRGHPDADPYLDALLGRRFEGGQEERGEAERAEDVLLPHGGDAAVGEETDGGENEQVGLQPVGAKPTCP